MNSIQKSIFIVSILFIWVPNLSYAQNESECISDQSWNFPVNFHQNISVGDTLDLISGDWNTRLFFEKQGEFGRLLPIRMCGLEPKPKKVDEIRGKWTIETQNDDSFLVMKINGEMYRFLILDYSNEKLLLVLTE